MVEVELIILAPKPGSSDAVVQALLAERQGYFAPPACLALDVIATADGSEVVATIRWASPRAHEVARALPQAGAFFDTITSLIIAEPAISTYRESAPSGALTDQVAVITGAASGIGRGVVDRFVREGARVVAVDRDPARLESLLQVHGEAVLCVTADISTPAGNEAAIAAAVERFGRIDTLVLNAGIFDAFTEFAALSPAEVGSRYEAIFDVNVRGPMLGASAALPHLVASRGSIIFTLSTASLYPDGGGLFYVASKHAGLGVMRQLAHEFAPHVRVNAVAPGATKTPIGVPDIFGVALDQTSDEISHAIAGVLPMRRHAEPGDMAGAYVLLASRSDGRNMTGTLIQCDGGIGIRGVRRVSGGDELARITEQAAR